MLTHSTRFWLGISQTRLRDYCDKPWLLCSVERVHLFGVVGGVDCNVPLLGLVVVNGVCMDGNFT